MRPSSRAGLAVIAAVVLAAAGGIAAERWQQTRELQAKAYALTGGDPRAGAKAIGRYGCGGCHTIPGVPGADGAVGPSLDGVAGRVFLAGEVRNEPANLMRWIQNPKSIDETTAMPVLGVTSHDARDIAYLYTLE